MLGLTVIGQFDCAACDLNFNPNHFTQLHSEEEYAV